LPGGWRTFNTLYPMSFTYLVIYPNLEVLLAACDQVTRDRAKTFNRQWRRFSKSLRCRAFVLERDAEIMAAKVAIESQNLLK
jgi:hypothetical protein